MFLGKLGHNYKCTEASGQSLCVKEMRESERNNNNNLKIE